MKKLLILLAMLSILVHAGETTQLGQLANVYHNYNQALSVAKASHKKIFILFEKENCGWCRKLKSTTLQDSTLVELLNNEFVVVLLNKNRDKFPTQYDPTRVPVVYMANYNEKVFVKKLGYISNPNEYIRLSKYVTP